MQRYVFFFLVLSLSIHNLFAQPNLPGLVDWNTLSSYIITSNSGTADSSEELTQLHKMAVYNQDTIIGVYKNSGGCYLSSFVQPHNILSVNPNTGAMTQMLLPGKIARIQINNIDTIYDFSILKDTIFFVGMSCHSNLCSYCLGYTTISELTNINSTNPGVYYTCSMGQNIVKKIKAFYDDNGLRHLVGIGSNSTSNINSLLFDFSPILLSSSFTNPNSNPILPSLPPICINTTISLHDIAITDNFVTLVGHQYGSQDLYLLRKPKNSNNITIQRYDYSNNVSQIGHNPFYDNVLIRHTYNDEIVILLDAQKNQNNYNTYGLLVDCIDMSTFTDIYKSNFIQIHEKNLIIRDAVYSNQDSTLLILSNYGIKDSVQDETFIIHAKPYNNLSTYECRHNTTSSPVFNAIDLYGNNKYAIFGISEGGKGVNCFSLQKINSITNCFDSFSVSVSQLDSIQYNETTASPSSNLINLSSLTPHQNLSTILFYFECFSN